MNNKHLCHYPFAKLSLATAILAALCVPVSADTPYGPLKAGETLSSIVNENYLVSPYPDAVIMREIFRMNPQAFIYNNMGLIKQGVTLTLPSDATIRRSQQPNSRPTGAVRPEPAVAPTASPLNETALVQLRNERDQANLRLRRIEADLSAQIKSLSTKVTLLESDNQKLTEQLTTAQTALEQSNQALIDVRRQNTQLVASEQQVAVSSNDNSEKLEESGRIIAEKERQITTLAVTITDLEAKAQESKVSNQRIVDAKVAETNLAHRQQLAALQASFEAKAESTDNSQIEISKLQSQHAEEIATLTAKHKQVLGDLNTSFESQLAEQAELQAVLKTDVDTLKENIANGESQIATLTGEKAELNTALTNTTLALESKASQEISGQVAQDSLTGPVTKQLLVKRLEAPVAFPLWGLLLGSFALGFTSLMVLFTRNRKQTPQVQESAVSSQDDNDIKKEALVFRASDPSVQDPDIETLRVAPRRDPSRVAILDPSMVGGVAGSIEKEPTAFKEAASVATSEIDTAVNDHQSIETKFKRLIAEAYEELGDVSAANQMLSEISDEKKVV